jgi:hypothetical protein
MSILVLEIVGQIIHFPEVLILHAFLFQLSGPHFAGGVSAT